MALMPIVKVVDLYVKFLFLSKRRFVFFVYRYRHELFNNDFGIEWMDDSDNEPRKTITEESSNDLDLINNHHHVNSKPSRSIITVRSIHNNATRLPAHIWRSLAKVK
jgi:hypothetical protein